MITIPLFWWYIPLILFLIPIIVRIIDKSYQRDLGFMLLALACWPSALAITITKLLCG